MTSKEIKSEIQKTIDKIPEEVLEDVLAYLKAFETTSTDHTKLSKNLREILTEDKNLLYRLAK